MENIKQFDYKDLFTDSIEPVFKNLLAEIISGSGVAKAQWKLGIAYYEGGLGLEVNYGKAVFLFSQSAKNSYEEDAFYWLGLCYFEGKGVAKDEEKAAYWLRKAAGGGNSDAILLLNTIDKHDKIRGCLVGGAAGDALGYAVEFIELEEIHRTYSPTGITAYNLDNSLGKGIISDDTQMTLFTAHGLLVGDTRLKLRGIAAPMESYLYSAYIAWLQSQTGERTAHDGQQANWLLEIPELCIPRHPGTTCIHALHSGKMGTIEKPINNSKGCGGVMRVAPIALYFKGDSFDPIIGAKAAAITHGHPLGYMPAMALVVILHRIVYGGCTKGDTLYEIVDECCEFLNECCNLPLFYGAKQFINELFDKINLAKELSRNDEPDAQNIHRIGGGWVGEEALAIALYCSLKYYDDFSAAIIAAVNHDGDSDSTGSIVGNIVGAHVGYENISAKWKQNLQLRDLILKIADDITNGCQMEEYGSYFDEKWFRKYSC